MVKNLDSELLVPTVVGVRLVDIAYTYVGRCLASVSLVPAVRPYYRCSASGLPILIWRLLCRCPTSILHVHVFTTQVFGHWFACTRLCGCPASGYCMNLHGDHSVGVQPVYCMYLLM